MSAVDQDAPELLPCPFCGSPAWLWFAFPQSETPWFVSIEHENDCILRDAMGSMHCCASSDEMAAAWNRRAAPSAPAEVEGLVNDAATVRCNQCMEEWHGDELEHRDCAIDGGRCDACPTCMTDHYLMDIEAAEAATALTAQQAEIERLVVALRKSNEGFERYERASYLAKDRAERAEALAGAMREAAASESAKVRAHRATIDSMARLLRDARRLLGDECEALRSSIAIIGQPGAMSQSPEDAPTREAIRAITDWMDRAERVLNMETNSDA